MLSVVAYHAFPGRFKGGFVGVDIFFVISGFLISTIVFQSLAQNRFSFAEFYSRRVLRIFPSLCVSLLACFCLGWFLLLGGELKSLGKHMAGGAGFVSNFILWNESGYFDAGAESKPLLHLWSLGIEEQFYIFFPFLMWCFFKARANLFGCSLVLAVVSFGLNLFQVHRDPTAAFYSPQTRFWELMIGVLLARWTLDRAASSPDKFSNLKSWAGAVLVALGFVLISRERAFPGMWALLPTLGAAFLISAGPGAVFNRRILSNGVLVWIGLISFPVYLWHWVLLSFVSIANAEAISSSAKAVLVLVSFLLAWLTYRFLERPIRYGGHRRPKTAGLVVCTALLGFLGLWTYRNGGFPSRAVAVKGQALAGYEDNRAFEETLGESGKACLLFEKSDFHAFASHGCEERPFPGRPTVTIAGDSHAAFLSLALRKYLGERKLNFVEYTAVFCPPFVLGSPDYGDRCQKINEYVFDRLKENPPDVLILFTHYTWWEQAAGKNKLGTAYDELILRKIVELRDAGLRRIVLVGPTPMWSGGLPHHLMRHFVLKGREIPKRTFEGVQALSLEFDDLYRKKTYPPGVEYVSLKDFLCDESGCLTSVGPDLRTDLVVSDDGHLTLPAATLVTESLLGEFFPR